VLAIILSSSDSAPLTSVMTCWSVVATPVNMSFEDEQFALGASNDWFGACSWLWPKGEGVGLCNWGQLRLLLLLCVAAQHRREGLSCGSVAGREHPSRCSLRRSLRLSPSRLFLGVPAASIVGEMRSLSVHQLALAACRIRCCIPFLGIPCASNRPHVTYNGEVACS
jgi:hypothetical protein